MQIKFHKSIVGIISPYLYIWGVASPVIELLSPNENIKVSAFIILIIASLSYWAYQQKKSRTKIFPTSSPDEVLQAVKNSIDKGVLYLESANNKNEHDMRIRTTLSAMETATVIGATVVGKKFLGVSYIPNQKAIAWVFEVLKSQFFGFSSPEKTLGFDCQDCRGKNNCNIAYFDYLSHFVYCKGTSLYDSLVEHFSFLGRVLGSRLIYISEDKAGWSSKFNESTLDPLSTATNLHLALILKSISFEKITSVLHWIVFSQNLDGSWSRPKESVDHCGANYTIITVHRMIEILKLCTSLNFEPEFSKKISDATSKAATFLSNTPLDVESVSYEVQAGYHSPEIYRAMGHIAQGLTKAEHFKSLVLQERINFIVNSQQPDGSFRSSSNLLTHDRLQNYYTDLTAFMIRTLVFYGQLLERQIGAAKGSAGEVAEAA